MAQRKGVHSLLELPTIYRVVQTLFRHKPTTVLYDSLLGPTDGKTLLDVGCGPGDDAGRYRSSKYIGLDSSSIYISKAKAQRLDHASFYCLDASRIADLEENYFDIVILKGVLHHLNDAAFQKCLYAIAEKMKQGSKIVTLDPVLTDNQGYFSRLMVKMDRGMHVRSLVSYKSLVPTELEVVSEHLLRQSFPPYQRLLMEITKA